jgi:hypothetical protein
MRSTHIIWMTKETISKEPRIIYNIKGIAYVMEFRPHVSKSTIFDISYPKYKELSATAQLSLQGVRSSNRTVAVRNKGKGVVEAQHTARGTLRELSRLRRQHGTPRAVPCRVRRRSVVMVRSGSRAPERGAGLPPRTYRCTHKHNPLPHNPVKVCALR